LTSVPKKKKELRQSFTQELPGLTLTIQSGESVAKADAASQKKKDAASAKQVPKTKK
jgi:hypothetical protein